MGILGYVGVAYGLISLATGVGCLISWLREPPVDPEIEERAMMRSLSWPSNEV